MTFPPMLNPPRNYRGEPPFQSSSETSRQAAEAIKPHRGKLAQRVYDYIKSQGEYGATQEEIHKGTGMRQSSVCGRVRELELAEHIIKTERKRLNDSGVQAFVYVAKEVSA